MPWDFSRSSASLHQVEVALGDGSVTETAVQVPGRSAVVDGSLDALQ